MAMAGAKSLRIYAFEEAGRWFDAAFSLLRIGAAARGRDGAFPRRGESDHRAGDDRSNAGYRQQPLASGILVGDDFNLAG